MKLDPKSLMLLIMCHLDQSLAERAVEIGAMPTRLQQLIDCDLLGYSLSGGFTVSPKGRLLALAQLSQRFMEE